MQARKEIMANFSEKQTIAKGEKTARGRRTGKSVKITRKEKKNGFEKY